jgi:OmpA-OmpF porin, OOP family
MRKLIVFFIFLVANNITIAQADDMYRGAWYALPGISYNWTDSYLQANNDIGVFLRGGKEISEQWDVQVGGSYASIDGKTTTNQFKQSLLGVDALYMFSREKLRPFLLAGLGYAHNKVDYINSSHSSIMANVGVGVQYLINDKFGVQADLRQIWSEAELGAVGATSNKTISNTTLNIGAVFRFGEPVVTVVAEPTPQPPPPQPLAEAPVSIVAAIPEPIQQPTCKPVVETVTIQSEALFGFDNAVIKKNGTQSLDEVVTKIKEHPDVEFIVVTGYTDRVGSVAYNQKLSEHRANAVKKYLIAQGIDDALIQSEGKGKSDPVIDCKGVKGSKNIIECLAPNRRVVIDATHKQEKSCGEN